MRRRVDSLSRLPRFEVELHQRVEFDVMASTIHAVGRGSLSITALSESDSAMLQPGTVPRPCRVDPESSSSRFARMVSVAAGSTTTAASAGRCRACSPDPPGKYRSVVASSPSSSAAHVEQIREVDARCSSRP